MTCESCGLDVEIGSWPFCPHGAYRGSNLTDEIPGGVIIENLGHEPMRFDSKKAILKEADKRGLEPFVRWTPGDKHLTRWDAIDPYTMAAAEVLVRRASRRIDRSEPDVPCDSAAFSVHEVKACS